jgi:tetratricopeptide (TPR) repeat protein
MKKRRLSKGCGILPKGDRNKRKVWRLSRELLWKLNLGNTYRKMKDYEKAEKYLLEGLEGVKKVGDKYWEATGYQYLGWLYTDKGDKKTAKDYLTRAYNLFKSIGAEGMLRESFLKYKSLKRKSSYIRRLSHEESLQSSFHHPQPFSL